MTETADQTETYERIRKLQADIVLSALDAAKREQDLAHAPWALRFAGATAMAALLVATAAIFTALGINIGHHLR